MKVVILCGGRGTRIRGVADDLPKPMIPVGGLPILWHIMKYYSCWGHTDFVLCLGYKGDVIRDFFLNYEAHTQDFTLCLGGTKGIEFHSTNRESGWRVTCAETGLETGTGARVKRVARYLANDEHFMLTYGDGVGNVDLDRLLACHQAHDTTITVTGVRPPGRFGELLSDDRGRVLEFNEKPQVSAGRISGGFFVCRRDIFDHLDDREDLMLEAKPVTELVRNGQMGMYEHDGFWHPMDTYRDHVFLNGLCESGRAPWKIW